MLYLSTRGHPDQILPSEFAIESAMPGRAMYINQASPIPSNPAPEPITSNIRSCPWPADGNSASR